MRREGIPLTVERYRALAHFPDPPSDLEAEEEADLPEELFQDTKPAAGPGREPQR